ncbi:SH3 domain-containing protein [Pontixanthobacter sp. CEM42]|uniref:SH3 domain-containing protein n=1 Tax=Pontixanthobacter sp. CEM42 TaxID=2792077 RepID=UPI001AE025C0|nr:SH3 domain-containing protein [Pontixanthobacter sp. CEM42]
MKFRILPIIMVAALVSVPGQAQKRETPYWATIDTSELNMRVGPSREYKIEWVYKRDGLPVKVVRVAEGWRLVRDSEGTEGWVSGNLLSANRGAVVVGEGVAAMRDAPADTGKLKWNAAVGVVGSLGNCSAGWCEFDVGGREGWIKQNRIWGAGEP